MLVRAAKRVKCSQCYALRRGATSSAFVLQQAVPPATTTEGHSWRKAAASFLGPPLLFGKEKKDPIQQAKDEQQVARFVADLEAGAFAGPRELWAAYTALNSSGLAPSLADEHFPRILQSLRQKRPLSLTLANVVDAAHTYAGRVALLETRIQQLAASRAAEVGLTKGTRHHLDLLPANERLVQFATWGYAPGALDALQVLMDAKVAEPRHANLLAKAVATWMGLQERGAETERAEAKNWSVQLGKVLQHTLAQPAHAEAAPGLDVISDHFLGTYLEVLSLSGNVPTFHAVFKEAYGFDVNLPGGRVYESSSKLARRELDRRAAQQCLKVLAQSGDLSKLMAVFEVFDSPPASLSSPSAQAQFFSSSYAAEDAGASTADLQATLSSPQATGRMGSQEYAIVLHALAKAGNWTLMKHYYKELERRNRRTMRRLVESATLYATEVRQPNYDARAAVFHDLSQSLDYVPPGVLQVMYYAARSDPNALAAIRFVRNAMSTYVGRQGVYYQKLQRLCKTRRREDTDTSVVSLYKFELLQVKRHLVVLAAGMRAVASELAHPSRIVQPVATVLDRAEADVAAMESRKQMRLALVGLNRFVRRMPEAASRGETKAKVNGKLQSRKLSVTLKQRAFEEKQLQRLQALGRWPPANGKSLEYSFFRGRKTLGTRGKRTVMSEAEFEEALERARAWPGRTWTEREEAGTPEVGEAELAKKTAL